MRVVIADDIMLIREGTARLLEEAGVEVVGKADDARKLLQIVAQEHPDVAIVDIKMPPTHTDEGLVAAEQIRSFHPGVGVLVLSQYLESRYATRLLEHHPEATHLAVQAGATGVTVDAEQAGDRLIVTIAADGASGRELAPGLSDVSDRVGAVGGKLRVEDTADGAISIRAEIPCAL